MKYLIALLMLLSAQAYAADCSKPVTAMKSGDKSLCDGFLFSMAKQQEVRYDVELLDQKSKEFDLASQENVLLKGEIINLNAALKYEQKEAKAWQKDAEKYTKKYESLESSQTTRDILFFVAGGALVLVGGVGIILLAGHASAIAITAAVAVPK